MTISYNSGRRIQGTSTDATAVSGGWKELGRHKLTSAGDVINITSLDNKRYYMVLQNILGNGAEISPEITFNGDTTQTYPMRRSTDSGSDWTSTTYNYLYNSYGGTNTDRLIVGYIANKSNKEKLYQHHQSVNVNRSNAGTAPSLNKMVGKWVNTSDSIDQITVTNSTAGDFNPDSEVVVLGYDPDDTHTTNFWEQLASVNGDGTGGFSSGTFTAKKYLWVQTWVDPSASSRNLIRFNDDSSGSNGSTGNYSVRGSINGAADATLTSQTSIESNHTVPLPKFFNMFIINNSANEKLAIENAMYVANTGGAGGSPQRVEIAGKWANTSDQITKIDYIPSTGNYSTDSKMIVWGSN